MMPVRTFAVVCPDWPVVAAGAAGEPAVVVHAGRVVSCSAPARREGVQVGHRRREAEGLAGALAVFPADPVRDARMFEPLVAAIAAFTPRVEVLRPGVCCFPARGPARYFGGEQALAAKVVSAVDAVIDALPGSAGVGCRAGVAEGPFAALLAAEQQRLVVPGGTPAFLAPFPVSVLGLAELADLLRRLGIHTLGALGELPAEAVTARFGADGAQAWHLARGLDDRSLLLSDPPPDLAVTRELDPPAAQVEAVAFVAVGLVEELCERLRALELVCTRIVVEVETEHGETLQRLWRADRPFTTRTMVDRVRWQLEGWLAGTAGAAVFVPEPTGAIAQLRLAADEVARDRGRQLGLWGEESEADRRAEQGLARVQGLLGHEGVATAVPAGGRSPVEQVRLVPWGEPRDAHAISAPPPSRTSRAGPPPWPGRLPPPSPAVVLPVPVPATVLDAAGAPVRVSGRGELSAPPDRVATGRDREGERVAGWAGPWPVEERWWDGAAHRRRARLQVLLEGGTAQLLALEGGKWQVEALYD
jgi:protein ImuB